MTNFYRLAGTVLVFVGALLVLKVAFQRLSALDVSCNSSLPAGTCTALWLLLSALVVFFAFFLAMALTNRIWGRNVFKPRPAKT